ncbi:MAG: hypothetical protein WHV67_06325 [Thermoanaerobaculia bacterium]
MKVITFYLDEGHTIKKVMDEAQLDSLIKNFEKILKSKEKEKRTILGYDLNGNPFYIKFSAILALEVSDFDIKDL